MHKAWYHWLVGGGYRSPVHFCQNCEKKFRSDKIKIEKPLLPVNKAKFVLSFPETIKTKLINFAKRWKTGAKPIYKIFTCDSCGRKMYKAWHLWFILKGILIEEHFCKKCGGKLKLNEK